MREKIIKLEKPTPVPLMKTTKNLLKGFQAGLLNINREGFNQYKVVASNTTFQYQQTFRNSTVCKKQKLQK